MTTNIIVSGVLFNAPGPQGIANLPQLYQSPQIFGNNISIGGAKFNITSLSNGNIIQYDSTSGYWINVANTSNVAEVANSSDGTGTTIATYTPATQGNFMVMVYLRASSGISGMTITLTWTDSTGAQTYSWAISQTFSAGSYSFIPQYINSISGSAITLTASSGANVSGTIIIIK